MPRAEIGPIRSNLERRPVAACTGSGSALREIRRFTSSSPTRGLAPAPPRSARAGARGMTGTTATPWPDSELRDGPPQGEAGPPLRYAGRGGSCPMSITRTGFGLAGGSPVHRYEMRNRRGITTSVLTLGANLQSVRTHGRHGLDEITLSYDDVDRSTRAGATPHLRPRVRARLRTGHGGGHHSARRATLHLGVPETHHRSRRAHLSAGEVPSAWRPGTSRTACIIATSRPSCCAPARPTGTTPYTGST